jgi:hypothetical protein
MPVSNLSRGADAIAGRKGVVNNNRAKKLTTQWIGRSNTFPETLPMLPAPPGRLPPSTMDFQETRLPTQVDPLRHKNHSPSEGSVGGHSGAVNDGSQFATVPGTPREQWYRPSGMEQLGYQPIQRRPERLSLEDMHELQERERQKRQQELNLFQQFCRDSRVQNAADDDLGGAQRSDDILDDDDSDEELLNRVNRNFQREREPFSDRTNLSSRTPSPNGSSEPCNIPEWDGCTQAAIIKRLKAIDKDQLKDLGIREFF